MNRLIVGIDATNLRRGGGLTHLIEILTAASPDDWGIKKVIVWSGEDVLGELPSRSWLVSLSKPSLNGGLISRAFWQKFYLSKEAVLANCDVLFVPGGSYSGKFKPVVTMCRNLLPFDGVESRRYTNSAKSIRLKILRFVQTQSFLNAEGLIFLNKYARNEVVEKIGTPQGKNIVISHGCSTRFRSKPKFQAKLSEYNFSKPFRLLYVSTIEFYKHQWHLVEAVNILRQQGYPVSLDLAGPSYGPALEKLKTVLSQINCASEWVRYHGPVAYEDLDRLYKQSDLSIFASSCENMPNILLESMAAGLPIACSNRGPMPEILGDCGVYFNPEDPADIAQSLKALLDSPKLRSEMSQKSYNKSKQYSWETCAKQTFSFLSEIAIEAKR